MRTRRHNTSTKILSTFIALGIILSILLFRVIISSIALSNYEETSLTSEEFISVLNDANEITIIKKYASFGNCYYIIVDGKIIGQVKGEAIHLFGDCFTMRSSNGDLVMYENEEILHLNNQASVRDSEGEEVGRIESKYISFLDRVYYKVNNKILATDYQKFSILRKDVIKDNDGNTLFVMSSKNLFASKIIIEVEDNSVISPTIAIFMATINEAIDSSSSSSHSSND